MHFEQRVQTLDAATCILSKGFRLWAATRSPAVPVTHPREFLRANDRHDAQSTNPLLKMQTGTPEVRTLCSKCKLACPKSEPFAQNASWRVQSLNPLLKMKAGGYQGLRITRGRPRRLHATPGTQLTQFALTCAVKRFAVAEKRGTRRRPYGMRQIEPLRAP